MGRVLPILFNTDMVRAILDGRKTVTRRSVKSRSKKACGFYVSFRKSDNAFMGVYDYDENERQFDNPQIPPYQPGDILYVRETWCNANKEGIAPEYYYYADTVFCEDYDSTEWKWRPSIHMPKEAARIWLKVIDVRVERLQDMETEDDQNYMAEGATDKHDFIQIWNQTVNDIKAYGWYVNPWVWVIEFERCGKPEEL
ncbi:MAG: hypothetical protein NC548_63770 [Lachnospiraceae bacterium]|nr:hypothetical protein [Lachnospiraceae bacterium]